MLRSILTFPFQLESIYVYISSFALHFSVSFRLEASSCLAYRIDYAFFQNLLLVVGLEMEHPLEGKWKVTYFELLHSFGCALTLTMCA